jgi:hypothetical protein
MNPGQILTIRNTFSTHLPSLLFSASLYSENAKTYLLSCTHNQNPKNTITASYLIYCIIINFIAFVIIFIFTYIHRLVLENHSVELETQDEEFFCRLLEEE